MTERRRIRKRVSVHEDGIDIVGHVNADVSVDVGGARATSGDPDAAASDTETARRGDPTEPEAGET